MKKHTIHTPKSGNELKPSASKRINIDFSKIIWYSISVFLAITFIILFPKTLSISNENFFSKFISGKYQASIENNLLKNPFIVNLKKFKNKYEYALFNKIDLKSFFVGKENYIYEEGAARAYFGDDYYGDASIRDQVRKAKFVQTKLKELGIEFLLVFAPGKCSVYPEFLPDYVQKTKKKKTNIETYSNECAVQDVNCIDFVSFFKRLKPRIEYPLYSKYGMHWSYFSECIVLDTTIRRLEKLTNLNLPNIRYGKILESEYSLFRDADIFRRAEMEIPPGDVLAYPQSVQYEYGPHVKPQKILAIGDSFLKGFFLMKAMIYAFDYSKQWFYYTEILPESPSNPEVWELDLFQEILKNKIVLILATEGNLKKLGFGFIDDAYELFSNKEKYYLDKIEKDKTNIYKKEIRKNDELLSQLTDEAHKRGITIDSVITETAIKLRAEGTSK